MRGLKFLHLILGAALIWFLFLSDRGSSWLAGKFARDARSTVTVGRILSSKGTFTRIRAGEAETYSTLPGPLDLYDGDRIETQKNSSVLAVMNSQDEIEIAELSSVSVQLWNPHDNGSPLYLQLNMGALESKKAGIRGKAYVVRDGKLFFPGQKPVDKPMSLSVSKATPVDIQLADAGEESDGPDEIAEAKPAPDEPDIPMGAEPQTLSNEYIDQMIAGRQGQLQKCWLSRLKDNPNLRGQLIVQFEISRRGKVRELRVADATFDDDTLKRCVMSVIERISFRPFKGQEISLSYPINFE
jgi:hypothetical protein